eukprot:1948113-Rhodomonas_salina.1
MLSNVGILALRFRVRPVCSRAVVVPHVLPSQAHQPCLACVSQHESAARAERGVCGTGPPQGKLGIAEAWRPWMVDNQVAGYTKSYVDTAGKGYLGFATVKGAGHTVPEYKPAEALHMFSHFINHLLL